MALTKTEEFAKKIIQMAAEENLSVGELYRAADMAKGISDNSTVEVEAIGKTDFPSQYICTVHEELFTPEDSSGTKYSAESIGIPCPIIDHEKEIGLNPFRL